jgi:RNA polymerase sigma-70 factor (ECF subfamily)
MSAPTSHADVSELLQHSAWIRHLARVLVRDEALADDLVQETWLAALRSPPRAGEPARPWLAEVLRNALRMRLRGEGRRRRREEASAGDARPDSGDSCAHAQRLLAEQLLRLDEPYRGTLLLRYYEGLSAVEIAARQMLPAATVRGRIKQGIERLRAELDRRPGGRGAWLAALAPLADGRHALTGAAASSLKGAVIMKGAVSATALITAVAGVWLVGQLRDSRAKATSRPAAQGTMATATATTSLSGATAAAAQGTMTSPSAASAGATPPMLPRIDPQMRAEMLRRLDEARQQQHANVAAQGSGAAQEEPQLDKDYIRQQIRQLLPQMSECYSNALAHNPKLEGRMVVDFSIVGDPSVGGLVGNSRIKDADSTIADAEMRECVQETMYAAQFVAPKSGGEVQVTYPFVFKTVDDENGEPPPSADPPPLAQMKTIEPQPPQQQPPQQQQPRH